MSIFDSIQNFFEPAPSVPVASTGGAVPTPVRRPTETTSSSGGFLGDLGSIFKSGAEAVKTGVESFYGAKSQYEQLKTAQEIEKIKLNAVVNSAKQAPAPAQIILPTFGDFLNDPQEAASRITPAAIAGSAGTGLSIATLGILGVTLFLIARK